MAVYNLALVAVRNALLVATRIPALLIILLPANAAAGRAMANQWVARVDLTVHVSVDLPQRTHTEVVIGAAPRDRKRLIACSIVEPHHPALGGSDVVAYLSDDRGVRWRIARVFAGRIDRMSDPSCTFTATGRPVVALLSMYNEGGTWGVTPVYTLRDDGTWSEFDLPYGDRDFVISGPVGTGNRPLYVAELAILGKSDGKITGFLGNAIYRSVDDGLHFEPYMTYATTESGITPGFGPGSLLTDGTPIVPLAYQRLGEERHGRYYATLPSASSKSGYFKSVVAGPPTHFIAPYPPVIAPIYPCNNLNTTYYMPGGIAVDWSRGRFRGRAYFVWTGYTDGRCQSQVSYSGDGGRTWSHPVIVSDAKKFPGGPGPDDANATIAVNSTGVIGVMWYDRRRFSDDVGWQPRFAFSTDGGMTFSHSIPITENTMNVNRRQLSVAAYNISPDVIEIGWSKIAAGETAGLVTDADGVFHPLWVDNSSGVDQLYTAAIHIDRGAGSNSDVLPGPAVPGPRAAASEVQSLVPVNASRASNGVCSSNIARFLVVHSGVRIDPGNAIIDRQRHEVSFDAYVIDMGRTALRGPLILRLTSIETRVASEITAANADNRLPGPGACWTTSLGVGQILAAPGATIARRLVFHVRGLRPITYSDLGWNGVAGSRFRFSFQILTLTLKNQ